MVVAQLGMCCALIETVSVHTTIHIIRCAVRHQYYQLQVYWSSVIDNNISTSAEMLIDFLLSVVLLCVFELNACSDG